MSSNTSQKDPDWHQIPGGNWELKADGKRIGIVTYKGYPNGSAKPIWEWKIPFKQGEVNALADAVFAIEMALAGA